MEGSQDLKDHIRGTDLEDLVAKALHDAVLNVERPSHDHSFGSVTEEVVKDFPVIPQVEALLQEPIEVCPT